MLVRDGGDLDDIPLTPVQPEKPGRFRPSALPPFLQLAAAATRGGTADALGALQRTLVTTSSLAWTRATCALRERLETRMLCEPFCVQRENTKLFNGFLSVALRFREALAPAAAMRILAAHRSVPAAGCAGR